MVRGSTLRRDSVADIACAFCDEQGVKYLDWVAIYDPVGGFPDFVGDHLKHGLSPVPISWVRRLFACPFCDDGAKVFQDSGAVFYRTQYDVPRQAGKLAVERYKRQEPSP